MTKFHVLFVFAFVCNIILPKNGMMMMMMVEAASDGANTCAAGDSAITGSNHTAHMNENTTTGILADYMMKVMIDDTVIKSGMLTDNTGLSVNKESTITVSGPSVYHGILLRMEGANINITSVPDGHDIVDCTMEVGHVVAVDHANVDAKTETKVGFVPESAEDIMIDVTVVVAGRGPPTYYWSRFNVSVEDDSSAVVTRNQLGLYLAAFVGIGMTMFL